MHSSTDNWSGLRHRLRPGPLRQLPAWAEQAGTVNPKVPQPRVTETKRPRRKHIRLDRSVYSWSGTVFSVTVCTADKQAIFAHPGHARLVFDSILHGRLTLRTECYAVCLMPDHVHLLVAPRGCDLVWALQQWKSWTTRRLHALGWRGPAWQRSFYDHALRGQEDVKAAALYIVSNPVRRGLVAHWKDYPYGWCQGHSPPPRL